jgi:thiol-disulfide isomerase/thioredoxin
MPNVWIKDLKHTTAVQKYVKVSGLIAKFLLAPVAWLESYDEAVQKAAKTSGDPKKGAGVVMALFTGSDWCGYCQALDQEVFQSGDFRLWFNARLIVPLMVDFPQNKPQTPDLKQQNALLLQQYNVQSFPTVIALKAMATACLPNGTCIVNVSESGRVVGYKTGSGPANWIKSFSTAANLP